jgi:hypothetical protein
VEKRPKRDVPITSLVTRELDERLKAIAENEYRTLSATIAILLSEAMERRANSQ